MHSPLIPKLTRKALRLFGRQHPKVSSLEIIFPDLLGAPRGKKIFFENFSQLEKKLLGRGLSFPLSIYLADSRGEVPSGLPLLRQLGDPDFFVYAAANTLKLAHWKKPFTEAQVIGAMEPAVLELEGAPLSPAALDCRSVLQRVVQRFKQDFNLSITLAVELEFYLLSSKTEFKAPLPRSAQCYSLADEADSAAFFEEARTALAALELPLQALVSEYGHGQFELNLLHRDDPLRACDEAFFLKRLVKQLAKKQGRCATFMAKPSAATAGSGMHLHVALFDAQGRNYFTAPATQKNSSSAAALLTSITKQLPLAGGRSASQNLLYAVAGLLALHQESLALFAVNANSYRRFAPDSFVPLGADWGVNSRSVALRIPYSGGDNLRLEHRVAGADANPYLAAAAVLAAIHYGLTQKKLPPPPTLKGASPPIIPPSWDTALAHFAAASVLPSYLGSPFIKLYYQNRCSERAAFEQEISEKELRWFLEPA